jgi:hypothetical protein
MDAVAGDQNRIEVVVLHLALDLAGGLRSNFRSGLIVASGRSSRSAKMLGRWMLMGAPSSFRLRLDACNRTGVLVEVDGIRLAW